MLFLVVAVVVYIVWPEARPIVAALALLTVLGFVLTLAGRR